MCKASLCVYLNRLVFVFTRLKGWQSRSTFGIIRFRKYVTSYFSVFLHSNSIDFARFGCKISEKILLIVYILGKSIPSKKEYIPRQFGFFFCFSKCTIQWLTLLAKTKQIKTNQTSNIYSKLPTLSKAISINKLIQKLIWKKQSSQAFLQNLLLLFPLFIISSSLFRFKSSWLQTHKSN